MRRRFLFLLLTLALPAGCVAPPTPPDESADEPPESAGDDTAQAPQEPEPVTPAANATAKPPANETAELAPFEPVQIEHDYSDAAEEKTFQVPATAVMTLRMAFRAPETLPVVGWCQAEDARILVTGPDDGVFAEREVSTPLFVTAAGGACGPASDDASRTFPPGTYTVSFTGSGTLVGIVEVRPEEA